jgi:hypothetical protein
LNPIVPNPDQIGSPQGESSVQSGVTGSVNIQSKLAIEPAPATKRRGAIWPLAWLALSGVAMVGWLLAIGWIAVTFVGWLWG